MRESGQMYYRIACRLIINDVQTRLRAREQECCDLELLSALQLTNDASSSSVRMHLSWQHHV